MSEQNRPFSRHVPCGKAHLPQPALRSFRFVATILLTCARSAWTVRSEADHAALSLVLRLGAAGPFGKDVVRHGDRRAPDGACSANRLREVLGLRRVRLYDARSSCFTFLADNGVPDHFLARWAGHEYQDDQAVVCQAGCRGSSWGRHHVGRPARGWGRGASMSHAVCVPSVSPSRTASKIEVDPESGSWLRSAGVREGSSGYGQAFYAWESAQLEPPGEGHARTTPDTGTCR
ncbi:hypothetical protein B9S64_28380 [Streptomyces sp. SM18]|nr:hypothetical protein B9S64_28380 [Streptomyces sp. SM18]